MSPRARFAHLPPERRAAILAAAADEFAAASYDQASLNRILERAHVSKGAFYYYFDDKADLFATVIDQATRTMLPSAPVDLDALTAESFWPTLELLFRATLEAASREPWVAVAGKLFYGPPPAELTEVLQEHFLAARRWLAALVARGQELGAVRTDLPTPLLLAMIFGAGEAADRWFVEHWQELAPAQMALLAPAVFASLQRLAAPAVWGERR